MNHFSLDNEEVKVNYMRKFITFNKADKFYRDLKGAIKTLEEKYKDDIIDFGNFGFSWSGGFIPKEEVDKENEN